MIIVHEDLPDLADEVAETLRNVYGFPTDIFNRNLEGVFTPTKKWKGYLTANSELTTALPEFKDKAILVLIDRDLYLHEDQQEDNWILGYSCGRISAVSIARLKRSDREPSDTLEITHDKFLKRVNHIAIHEIGHDAVQGDHHELAVFVNAKTNYKMRLGNHCPDSHCVMYEIIDVIKPDETKEYMLIGDKKITDAGLDVVLENAYPDWFCSSCKDSITLDAKYF